MVGRLTGLSDDYRRKGDEFFAHPAQNRDRLYFGPGSLASTARSAEDQDGLARILVLNEDNMEAADKAARRWPLLAVVVRQGSGVGIALAVLLIGSTIRTILYPMRAVTESAAAIGAGDLDQLVPITSHDELGQLAATFNAMARQLREFRQSHKAQLIRAQQTSQATIDSFPDPVLVIDPQQQVEMANPVARAAIGRAPVKGATERSWSGIRPSRCASRWPPSCKSIASICPKASTRPWCSRWTTSCIRSCRGSCRFAIRFRP